MERKAISSVATILLLFLQTCPASSVLPIHHCPASSCGNTPNISYPFRLSTDPPNCGDKRYELCCENNATILTLFSGKYYVHEIDYKRYTIRVSDAGVVEDTTCSFIPRYFFYYSNFSQNIFGPGTDLLNLEPFDVPRIAYFNCTNPITDDPRYVKVDTTRCGTRGHIYAVLKNSSNDFSVMDIKVGCQLKVATFGNWGTKKDHKNKKNVSYDDIHNMLAYGFGLSWLNVICEAQCGEGKGCSVINESSGQIQCDWLKCRYIYRKNEVAHYCGVPRDCERLDSRGAR